jgi:hypothetical protein
MRMLRRYRNSLSMSTDFASFKKSFISPIPSHWGLNVVILEGFSSLLDSWLRQWVRTSQISGWNTMSAIRRRESIHSQNWWLVHDSTFTTPKPWGLTGADIHILDQQNRAETNSPNKYLSVNEEYALPVRSSLVTADATCLRRIGRC